MTQATQPQFLIQSKEYKKLYQQSISDPEVIEVVEKLPKTRSGKIMRRLLRAKELNTEIGDTSTLED